ncbi:MAG: CRISPR-associated helicase/endonuclease Cas3, partial [Eubacteriales bacterium]
MIPVINLRPCVAVIANLVKHFNASAVLCTATQPFLSDLIEQYAGSLQIQEICPHTQEMFQALSRVTYRYAGKLPLDELAARLSEHRQVLCIVNTRQTAKELFDRLDGENCFHLSTLMYPKHRQAVFEKIKKLLEKGERCIAVSTSLIEAGVDMDFPAVFREITGLDSVVQAAGRCNREGKRQRQDSIVTVFECDSRVPPLMKVNIAAAKEVMPDASDWESLGSPASIERYFKAYRSLMGNELDKSKTVESLTQGIAGCALPFKSVAQMFRMIDSDTKTVYIPLYEAEDIVKELREGKASKALFRRAGSYGVNLYENHYRRLLQSGDIVEIGENCAYLQNLSLYSERTGLSTQADEGKAQFV